MEGKATTLKLLEFSRIEAGEIADKIANATEAAAADYLSPRVSEEMQTALMVYAQFLTKKAIPYLPCAEVETAFEQATCAWKRMLDIASPFLPDSNRRDLLLKWQTANAELGTALRKENESRIARQAYTELLRSLEEAAEAAAKGITEKTNAATRQTQKQLIAEAINTLKDEMAEPRKKGMRAKGVCEFSGNEVHPKIYIEPGEFIKIGSRKYNFTGNAQWEIIARFLRSINTGDGHEAGRFPVIFTSQDYNKCKGDCRALVNDFVERQPATRRERNRRYEDRARFCLEMI